MGIGSCVRDPLQIEVPVSLGVPLSLGTVSHHVSSESSLQIWILDSGFWILDSRPCPDSRAPEHGSRRSWGS
ncbi:hypothetical protein FIBSPDRAFT_98577 [Athelia psychrophila]|uniref:Uncharacterized protein n=1 Tax=Athelia psychrophila TaxID=1759441 RepID=A0A166DQV7_9AGAM|nr:hypothetical protein FIBSPDRAFT_98577 [Fibularhizoctonia sp. CBS 109695]